MKVNAFLLFISLIVCGLIFYGFYVYAHDVQIATIATAFSVITLMSTLGLSFRDAPRSSMVFKAASGTFFTLMLAANIIMAACNVSMPAFIISNGVVLSLWAMTAYFIRKSDQ